MEMLVALCVFSILLGLGFQGARNSKREAERRAEEGEAKILNDAIRRVETRGSPGQWLALSNILFVRQDKDEAVQWLEDNGYVSMRRDQAPGGN